MENIKYFMDEEREAHRLTVKVNEKEWVNRFLKSSFQDDYHVLDVGCGPGVIIKECSTYLAQGYAAGVDMSCERIEIAEENAKGIANLHFFQATAENLPFDDDSFDVVYSRFLFEYLSKPQSAINEMKRVCKSGGTIMLQDLDGQLLWNYPEDVDLQNRIQRAVEYLGKSGFDPFVGRKLFSLMQNTGLDNIHLSIEPYHCYAGKISDKEYAEWELKLDIAKEALIPVFGKDESCQLKDDFLSYLLREDTFSYSNLITVSGQVS